MANVLNLEGANLNRLVLNLELKYHCTVHDNISKVHSISRFALCDKLVETAVTSFSLHFNIICFNFHKLIVFWVLQIHKRDLFSVQMSSFHLSVMYR